MASGCENWFCLDLGDAMVAAGQLPSLAESLAQLRAGVADSAALQACYRHETRAGLHCHVVVYLAPAFAPFARRLGASPCAKPKGGDLTPL